MHIIKNHYSEMSGTAFYLKLDRLGDVLRMILLDIFHKWQMKQIDVLGKE